MVVPTSSRLVPAQRAVLAGRFDELPQVLSAYANNVRAKVRVSKRHGALAPTPKNVEQNCQKELLDAIRNASGREYRDKVVAVMRVTHKLADRKPPSTGETLRKMRQRSRVSKAS
jgi:hypothetical protein